MHTYACREQIFFLAWERFKANRKTNWFLYLNTFSADGNYEVTLMTKATVYFDGRVIWEVRLASEKTTILWFICFLFISRQLFTSQVVQSMWNSFPSVSFLAIRDENDTGLRIRWEQNCINRRAYLIDIEPRTSSFPVFWDWN